MYPKSVLNGFAEKAISQMRRLIEGNDVRRLKLLFETCNQIDTGNEMDIKSFMLRLLVLNFGHSVQFGSKDFCDKMDENKGGTALGNECYKVQLYSTGHTAMDIRLRMVTK